MRSSNRSARQPSRTLQVTTGQNPPSRQLITIGYGHVSDRRGRAWRGTDLLAPPPSPLHLSQQVMLLSFRSWTLEL